MSILTCRYRLFAALLSLQLHTSRRNVSLNLELPLSIGAPLCAVPSSFCKPSALTPLRAKRRFITIQNGPLRMLRPTTYVILGALMLLSGGVIHSATLSEVQSQVFDASCTSCHSGSSPSQGLNLSAGAVGTDATRTTADEIKTYIQARIATGS